jgi:hypothetical protein
MKPVLNYFVPFTNGKFVASCLMFSDDVCGKPNEFIVGAPWHQNEYSDIDFWWKDHEHDWFNTENWRDYLSPNVLADKYSFYTCHEDYAVRHIKYHVTNSRILTIIPDIELCKRNYDLKNWIEDEADFFNSRVYQEYNAFRPILDDIVIRQSDLFDPVLFVKTIEYLCQSLNISLDMEKVIAYRDTYFSQPSNKL